MTDTPHRLRRPLPQIGLGVLFVMATHLLQVALFVVLLLTHGPGEGALPNSILVVLGFGIIQWLYVVPMGVVAALRRRGWLVLGMVLAALLTVAANAVVALVILGGPGHMVP